VQPGDLLGECDPPSREIGETDPVLLERLKRRPHEPIKAPDSEPSTQAVEELAPIRSLHHVRNQLEHVPAY